jgi:tetratricopeptide (TPR) repeat protein
MQLLAAGAQKGQRRGELQALAVRADSQRLSPASALLLASLLQQEGSATSAIRLLRAAQEQHPGDVWLNRDLARLLHRLGGPHLNEAIRFYSAACAIRPEIGHGLAHALERKGNVEDAIRVFRQLIRLRPNNVNHSICLARIHNQLGQRDEALGVYRQALEANPAQSRLWFNLVDLLIHRRDHAEAEAAVREGLRREPQSARGWALLGIVLHNRGKAAEAEAAYRRGLALGFSDPDLRDNLARILAQQRKLTDAAEQWEILVRDDRPKTDWLLNLGKTRVQQRRLDDAVKHFRRASELDPNSAEAHFLLGLVLVDTGRYADALPPLTRARQLDPKNAPTLGLLGRALRGVGRNEESLHVYREALLLTPKDSGMAYNFGNALLGLGRTDEAISAFHQALASQPTYAEAHCNLAHALGAEGDFRAALEHARRGHDLGMRRGNWHYPSADWVRHFERLAAIETVLPEILAGRRRATTSERLLAIEVCGGQRKHAARVKLIRAALAEDSALAEHPDGIDRASAALSPLAIVQGASMDCLPESPAALRGQALMWMLADLDFHRAVLKQGSPAARGIAVERMRRWFGLAAFNPVRARAALAQLPEEERRSWRLLWREAASLAGVKRSAGDF